MVATEFVVGAVKVGYSSNLLGDLQVKKMPLK
jgi:hypothetical protein